jgi:hypothetical protein
MFVAGFILNRAQRLIRVLLPVLGIVELNVIGLCPPNDLLLLFRW